MTTITKGRAEVEVILASMHPDLYQGRTLWTIRCRYWRGFHSEVMTHRALAKNAGSSRAKPVKGVISQIWNDPAGPTHWGRNNKGMQSESELSGWRLFLAKKIWSTWGKVSCGFAWTLMKLGGHKQWVNRGLEPWQYIDVLITATDWDNFFSLRAHEAAQPEFQDLARAIKQAMLAHSAAGKIQTLKEGEWHMPYLAQEERESLPLYDCLRLSVARCARVSFAPFDGNGDLPREFQRAHLLFASWPKHLSPAEHQARPLPSGLERSRHLQGWEAFRVSVENLGPLELWQPPGKQSELA